MLIALLGSIVYYLINGRSSTDDKTDNPSVKSTAAAGDSSAEASSDEALVDGEGPEAPTFSVASGTYDEEIEVYIEAGEGSIYYTINGVTPTLADSIFNGVDHIVFEKNGIYTMNKGDEFSVRIKNENVTIATVLFNAYTLGIGGTENNTRVYINYGGTIAEEEYMNLNDDSNSDMSYELGDINLDHTVDSLDKTFLDRYISGKEELNTVQLKLADMNGDGVVNVFDVNLLQKKINK